MVLFGPAHGWGEAKSPAPLMMKLGTVIPYTLPKEDLKGI